MSKSPAESAKLQSGDVVLKVNDQAVSDPGELQLNIASRNPGDTVKLEIVREGKTRNINVKLGEMPEDETSLAALTPNRIDLGFSVSGNNTELADKYGLSNPDGVVITSVNPGSEAQQKGLKAGDRIVEIERKNIGNIDDFNKALEGVNKDQVVLMLIEVRGGKRFVTIRAK